MANKSIIAIFILAFVGMSLIITIPMLTLSVGLSAYDVIEETDDSFRYAPSNSSPVETLNIEVEYGNVVIKYVSPLVDYYAMIEVNIEMSGKNLPGKNYKDFFDVNLNFTNSSPSFIMEFNSNIDKLAVLPLIKNITIVVNLRADIIYDINLTVLEGNTEISVPFGVFVNNVAVRSTSGNIKFDFNYGVIGGNITGITAIGNIILNAYDVEYFRDSAWVLTTGTGDINLEIYQYKDMGADVTGGAVTTNGSIFLTYKDSNPNVGAMIETDGVRWDQGQLGGLLKTFEGFQIGDQIVPPRPNEVFSNDFPTTNNYEILLITTSDYYGKIYLLDLSSS